MINKFGVLLGVVLGASSSLAAFIRASQLRESPSRALLELSSGIALAIAFIAISYQLRKATGQGKENGIGGEWRRSTDSEKSNGDQARKGGRGVDSNED